MSEGILVSIINQLNRIEGLVNVLCKNDKDTFERLEKLESLLGHDSLSGGASPKHNKGGDK